MIFIDFTKDMKVKYYGYKHYKSISYLQKKAPIKKSKKMSLFHIVKPELVHETTIAVVDMLYLHKAFRGEL
jgi:hypothetical protein